MTPLKISATIFGASLLAVLLSVAFTTPDPLSVQRHAVAEKWLHAFMECIDKLPDNASEADKEACTKQADGKAGVQ